MVNNATKKVLLIQPPAGTKNILSNWGMFMPYEIELAGGSPEKIIKTIKTGNHRIIISGLTLNGSLEDGLDFINILLKEKIIPIQATFIIYTYQGLVKDLKHFITKKWGKLPDNWQVIPKTTTYIFEHENLSKFMSKNCSK